MAGKGSKARPFSVPKEVFDNRWDLIFKKKENSNVSKEQQIKSDDDKDRQDTSGTTESKSTKRNV
jgi:hypothetical protein